MRAAHAQGVEVSCTAAGYRNLSSQPQVLPPFAGMTGAAIRLELRIRRPLTSTADINDVGRGCIPEPEGRVVPFTVQRAGRGFVLSSQSCQLEQSVVVNGVCSGAGKRRWAQRCGARGPAKTGL